MALALLLWMLAALTLLVSGLMTLSRGDVQLTRLQFDQARAEAAATGAGHLLLRELLWARNEGDISGSPVFVREYTFGDLRVTARAMPLGGLVDLNLAPVELLRDLFHYTGSQPLDRAERLAEDVVAWRAPGMPDEGDGEAGDSHAPFIVIEDLLRVPGMTRMVYDRVRHAVHVQPGGAVGIDPLAAPEEVLRTLAQGDASLVDFVLEARQDESAVDPVMPPGLAAEYLAAGGVGGYCLDIIVRMVDGATMRQRIWVDMAPGAPGLYWSYLRAHPVEVAH